MLGTLVVEYNATSFISKGELMLKGWKSKIGRTTILTITILVLEIPIVFKS